MQGMIPSRFLFLSLPRPDLTAARDPTLTADDVKCPAASVLVRSFTQVPQ